MNVRIYPSDGDHSQYVEYRKVDEVRFFASGADHYVREDHLDEETRRLVFVNSATALVVTIDKSEE